MDDVVYVLKPTVSNEELRYSLRSLSNLPHGEVWGVGKRTPVWVDDDELRHLRVPDKGGEKWKNLPLALRAAAGSDEISSTFYYFNDDFFVMESRKTLPVFHRGPIQDAPAYKRPTGSYGRGYHDTEKLLQELGHTGEILNYELHVPMPMERAGLADALDRCFSIMPKTVRALMTRTLYGNLCNAGGEYMGDVKVHGREIPKGLKGEAPFLSTNDGSFESQPIGKRIRAAFPDQCIYEKRPT